MARRRALIVGGSVGGLFAAHLLRAQAGTSPSSSAAAAHLADRGASIGTRAELFDVMRGIGIALDPSAGVAVAARICLDRAARSCRNCRSHSISSAWDRIYRPLRAAFPTNSIAPPRG